MEIQEVLSSNKRYSLIIHEFDVNELKLIIDAVESSKFINKKKSDELVRKLTKMVSKYQAEDLKRFISPVGHIEFDYESYYQTFDRINEAINAGKKVSFLYFKYDVRKEPKLYNDGKPYIFSPHRLIWNGSCFYMIGVLEYGKGIETFRIDRILNLPLIMEEDAFPFPEGFNLDEHLQNKYWMHGTDNTTVELICTNDLMDVILDEFGKDVTTYAYDMESFRAEVNTVISNAFFSWIFSFGGDIVINRPEDVKKQYQKRIHMAMEKA